MEQSLDKHFREVMGLEEIKEPKTEKKEEVEVKEVKPMKKKRKGYIYNDVRKN